MPLPRAGWEVGVMVLVWGVVLGVAQEGVTYDSFVVDCLITLVLVLW